MTDEATKARDRSADGAPASADLVVELSAVLVSVGEDRPRVLTRRSRPGQPFGGLPAGPFDPVIDRTLERGLRSWVREQTRVSLGYVEQLYTFGDRGRHPREFGGGPRVISVGYLALTRDEPAAPPRNADWQDWYRYFPWEDWRAARPVVLDSIIIPGLTAWAGSAQRTAQCTSRLDRARLCFGFDGLGWDAEKTLERYELLYEAGLVAEGTRDLVDTAPADDAPDAHAPNIGEPMLADHRRILATAIGRLRGKLKYRPVIFELMPPTFTLFQLQRTVEAIAGLKLHKQNFRRLVERSGLVESTERIATATPGRPAKEFRFRPEVVRERRAPGVHVPQPRTPRR